VFVVFLTHVFLLFQATAAAVDMMIVLVGVAAVEVVRMIVTKSAVLSWRLERASPVAMLECWDMLLLPFHTL
jgi:hypothetical protein